MVRLGTYRVARSSTVMACGRFGAGGTLISHAVGAPERKVIIPSPEKWGDRYQELIALYNKLLLRQ